MHNFYRFIFAVILSLITTLSFAQTIGDAEIAQVEQLRTSIDKVFNDLQDSTKTDDELVGLAVNINALEQELIAQGVLLSPRSSQINTRLKQLGPAPADGEPEEPELISDERIALNQEPYALLRYLDILRIDIAAMLVTLLSALGIVFLVWRLAEAIFSPTHANWRLLDISSAAARPLKAFVIIMVLVAALDYVTSEVNEIIGTSIPITIARSLVTSVVVGLMFLLIAFLRPFLSIAGMADEKPRPWPLIVKLALFLIGSVLIVTALAGYIGLARFMAQQLVVTGAVLTTMYLGYRTAHAISAEKALFGTRLGNRLANEMQFSETAVDQIGLVTGITMMAFVVVTGLPVLALLWGFQWADVRSFFVTFFTDIQIGSISLSITSILVGILLFAVGLFITRRFQRWLDGNVLARSGVDLGARNSISTIVLYIGVAVAGLLGVSAAGLQLSQLALVAGALSLGIGFGLQNIVSNFVSGLILLAERPFKSGDIIEAGGFTGVVKNIKVRATEVETFDKKTLILPNSELINSSVINWVHKTTLGRIEIPIGVGYDSDPQQVYTMLLDILNDHPRILSNPEPFVEFADFGASSLDFILRGYLADIGFGLTVRTELRMAIFERFKAAGIEIPFPQRDVNLKIVDGELKEVLPAKDSTEFGVIKTTNKRTLEGDDG
ncbi:Mechanosensitive channel MscK [Nymphon striatum]|nr:Mechanosensitive channel MscK [Nymphon striatum]